MEVLLRKASTLARACTQAASKIDLDPMLKLSPYSHATGNHSSMLSTASDKLCDAITEFTALHQAQSAIRRLIGQANTETVNPLLTERDYLNSIEKMLTGILDGSKMVSEEHTRRRIYRDTSNVRVEHNAALVQTTLTSLNQRASSLTTGEVPEVEVPALSPHKIADLEKQLASTRRRRSDLMDELAAANLNRKIRLPENVVLTLRKHGIIE